MAHTRVMASAVPGPEEASLMTRRVVGFVWPWAALWLLNQNVPVGDVAGKKTKAEWKAQLSPESFDVLVGRGTERAGSSPLDKQYPKTGTYNCAACDTPLMPAASKFDSGTGWPSFSDTIPGKVDKTIQPLYLLGDFGCRECRCHNCGGHIGHVFTDGPKTGPYPTGMRYCLNGVSLKYKPAA
eukprot:CAMPEP_0198212520 /NCGR_PEP_ID=MMETSP1445-20131203/26440_1 /TAXON_ID=36898 /ORGANISM="Pyramimonas sp., Strain CCMP2087" /LENGTH=182 /DNA_ID=CAMNT_0043886979 /DNA_START=283 /DNA_END=831 /DNA_ORIENTATION=+